MGCPGILTVKNISFTGAGTYALLDTAGSFADGLSGVPPFATGYDSLSITENFLSMYGLNNPIGDLAQAIGYGTHLAIKRITNDESSYFSPIGNNPTSK